MGTIPTPPTFTAGQKPTAAVMNQLRDATNFWAAPPQCLAYLSAAAQSIPDSTFTSVGLDGEVYDIVQAGDTPMHDTVTNNSRIYARTAGKYRIEAVVKFAANSTGNRAAQLIINGSTVIRTVRGTNAGADIVTVGIPPISYPLSVGDYVEVQAYQNSGGALNVLQTLSSTALEMKLEAA